MTVNRTHITTADLADAGACSDQIALFERTFCGAAEITDANMEKAIAAGLRIDWLYHLVPEAARNEYEQVAEPAWVEYGKATTSVAFEYGLKANREKRVVTQDEYDKIIAPARDQFHRTIAKPLVAALTGAKENA